MDTKYKKGGKHMANEELGKLSPEQVQKLANTISEAKNLTGQQEEIIKKVLAGEVEIGNTRIATLEKYFDIYSKNLDLIARKHSTLSDSFLILDQKLHDEYKTLSSDISKLDQQFAAANSSENTKNDQEVYDTQSQENRRKLEQLRLTDIEDLRKEHLNRLKKLQENHEDAILALELARSKKREDILLRSKEFRLSELATVTTAELKAQNLSNEIDTQLAYANTNKGAKSLGGMHASQLKAAEEEKSLQELKKQLDDKRIQLEYEARAKHNGRLLKKDAAAIEKQLSEEFSKRKESLNKLTAERFAQERLLAEAGFKDAFEKKRIERKRELELEALRRNNGIITKEELIAINETLDKEFTVRSARGKELLEELGKERLARAELEHLKEYDPAIAAAFDAERAERKRQLELSAMRKNNGIITEEERKKIDERLKEEFQVRSENGIKLLEELGKKQLANAELANIKENDPSLSAKLEAKLQKEIADEEYKYRKAHNNELDKQAREQIEQQAKQRLVSELAARKKIAKEELAVDRLREYDPGLAQKREAEIAKYKADLEYQFMLENEGKLTEEAIKNIKELADQKYATEGEAMEKLAKLRLQEETENRYKEANPEAGAALDVQRAKLIAEEERKLRQKNNRLLTKEEHDAIVKKYKEEFTIGEKNLKQLAALQEREDKKKKRADIAKTDQEIAHAVQLGDFSKEDNLLSRMDSLKAMVDSVDDEDKGKAQMAVAIKAISSLVAQLESKIDQIGSYKGGIDTRLQGSNNKTVLGSYWDQLNRDMMSVGAVTPFFKQEDFANNIKSLVERGISFDLKQRAFLMTIQEKIANTFDVADGTLLRLIRIQQQDSTAGRLGMESTLNAFLNEMYETSEYLTDVAKSVRSSLEEMESLMAGAEAAEVEYQVQKWMGSLYSVGMSQEAVNNIASALGQIAAGQVDALTSGNGAGNLMVMAANEAGLTISDILIKGLNAKETNKLLQATVNYLAELAESSKDNRVVQQQLANVFGIKASDLRAATNLASKGSTESIFGSYLTYDNMLKRLNSMAGTMYQRTSIGEMMTNVWENGQYTLAGSMANNPISYLTYKIASLLDSAAGGIAIPGISVMGNMVDLETTVADLMRVAAIGTGILGSLGSIISGLGSSFSGQAMLTKMGIEQGSGLKVTPRGNGDGISASAMSGGGVQTTSGSGYVGNASGSDIKNTTLQEAEDTKKQHMIEAKAEEEANQIDFINTNVLKIYELLDEVANGKRSLNVKVTGYGLTNLGSNTSLSGAQGGVGGLLSNNAISNTGSIGNSGNSLGGGFSTGITNGSSSGHSGNTGSSGSSGSGSSADFGVGTGIDLGGWTIM
jgi:hypothetical protein